MRDLERRALETDLRLLEPICEFVRREDHIVYRSRRFPTFYGGNGLELLEPSARSLTGWERLFHEEFPRSEYVHETFTMRRDSRTEPLEEAALSAGYHVEPELYMALEAPAPEQGANLERRDDLSVLRVHDDAGWRRLTEFHRVTAADEDWFDPEAEDNSLVAKTRYVADAIGVEWYLLLGEGNPTPLARAGIFFHQGLGRLQDIETHPEHRRRGYATRLVGHLLRRAFEEVGADAVCLCADENEAALGLYDRLGLKPLGRHVTLMRYPSPTI